MGGMLLPDIYLYSLFSMKLHPFPILLLLYFPLNSSVPGIGFSFFKKRVYLIGFFCFSFYEINRFCNKWKQLYCGKANRKLTGWILLHFLVLLELMGKTMHFPCGKVYLKIGMWWKKSVHMSGKKWVPIS